MVVDNVEDIFFRSHIVVHGAHGHIRCIGDLPHRRIMKALMGKHLHGTLYYLVSSFRDKPFIFYVRFDFPHCGTLHSHGSTPTLGCIAGACAFALIIIVPPKSRRSLFRWSFKQ